MLSHFGLKMPILVFLGVMAVKFKLNVLIPKSTPLRNSASFGPFIRQNPSKGVISMRALGKKK